MALASATSSRGSAVRTAQGEEVREVTTEVAGLRIFDRRAGVGQAVVILHHSFGNPGWLAFHDELSANHQVLVPDLPGFDASDRPDWARHPRDLAIVMGAWLDSLAEPVTVVGCGFGGWVAAELATMSPARLSRLVLVGAAGIRPREGRIFDQMLVSHSIYVRRMVKRRQCYVDLYGEDPTDETLLAWDVNREMVTRVAWKPYMYNRQLEPLLAEVDVPALVVWGDDDEIVPLECGERFRTQLPRADLRIVADCGHAVDLERPTELAEMVRAHVGSGAEQGG